MTRPGRKTSAAKIGTATIDWRSSAISCLVVAAFSLVSATPVPPSLNDRLSGDIVPAHDPVLIREGDSYYSYSTGQNGRLPILARTSRDLVTWRALPGPIAAIPDWALAAVPGAKDIWAPDIAYANGRYRLYYSVSTFGKQRSVIGLLTSPTLDPAKPGYGWRDDGLVIASKDGHDYNAIDPNFARDRQGGQWLAMGSYWTGLKLARLDPATGKLAVPGAPLIPIARRAPGPNTAIEASFIVDHGGWYWLVASFDHCCRGAKSDYHLVIGRSRAITGPYVDRAGVAMRDGGGTVLLQADAAGKDRFRGPGHAGFLHDRDGRDYLIYHAYDRDRHGAATLRLARMRWSRDGWPALDN
ncbi:ABC transporter substrate-binding protein [Sphingomonas sp. Leaf34]|uniref:arabinan endo-1,5-alpha-L-arabinosidase n=1 Tax=Sphingomonas sp. Leaf34 TaxID=1736216 RepID=UPI0006FE502E|nr:arabinan endo-1,5-alpha-L-arabinosidase [Sphingomonas sp. Leaf34]KQN27450.1 ABC transporter substrate-binding protein [Sphingomonas sp. Leaf34]